jgi:hypothetical protein
VGKLRAASYPLIEHNVVLVPMDGGIRLDAQTVKEQLDAIYRPYGISWNVRVDEVFSDRSWDTDKNGLQATGSEFYSVFTPEMRALNGAYMQQRGLDGVSVYLFVFRQAGESSNLLLGDMPLESRFGYIFNYSSGDKTWLTIAHELGHGIFQLRHPFSDKYGLKQGTTDNLLDYSHDGLVLKKYQWDEIHDPQKIWFSWLEEEGEGAIIDIYPIVKLNSEQFPVKTGGATFLTPAGLPIHFADMSKMEEMYFTTEQIHDCFNQQLQKDDCKKAINYIVADKGVLIGFKYEGKFYYPIIESAGNAILGTIKASDYIFRGYYNGTEYYVNDYRPTDNVYKVYWYENGWKVPYDICFNYTKYINVQYFNKEGYKGAGYYSTFIERKIANSCGESNLKELDNLDFFNRVLTARYNPWNNGGLLQKIKDRNGEIRLIYSIQEKDLSTSYYEYDYFTEDWVKVTVSSAEFSQYIQLDVIKEIANYYGHNALDIIGFIPVAGEVADALNGVWYLIEGEGGQTILCFASMLPVVADATIKGSKIVVKSLKRAAVRETFELSEEAFAHLARISDQLRAADGTLCDECVDALARLLAGHSGDIVEEVVKKARSVGLTLEEQAAFFTDLAKVDGRVSDATRLLVNNLNKIDEGIIEAWRLLDGSPVIRIDITNLENLKKVLQSQEYTKLGTLDGLKQAINSSSSKSKFIELLSNAKVIPGTNGKYVVIGTSMAERVEVFARDIKPMVGDNIELFNEAFQNNNKFVIDGVEKTWDKIMEDWDKLLEENKVKHFPYEPKYKSIVEGSWLYKANKQFI